MVYFILCQSVDVPKRSALSAAVNRKPPENTPVDLKESCQLRCTCKRKLAIISLLIQNNRYALDRETFCLSRHYRLHMYLVKLPVF